MSEVHNYHNSVMSWMQCYTPRKQDMAKCSCRFYRIFLCDVFILTCLNFIKSSLRVQIIWVWVKIRERQVKMWKKTIYCTWCIVHTLPVKSFGTHYIFNVTHFLKDAQYNSRPSVLWRHTWHFLEGAQILNFNSSVLSPYHLLLPH